MSSRSIRRAAERNARKQTQKESRLTAQKPHTAPGAGPNLAENPLAQWPGEPVVRLSSIAPAVHSVAALPETTAAPETAAGSERPTPRVLANRINARFSSGPRSPEGKSISSLNAVKTGLTGRTVLLPSDDAVAYQRHIQEYEAEFKPVGLRQRELVQSLADTQWRLQRIPGLEMAFYSLGSLEFADSYQEQPA